MANAQILEVKRTEAKRSKSYLAEKLSVSRPYMNRLLENPELCTVGQAETLCKELSIVKKSERDEIFLP